VVTILIDGINMSLIEDIRSKYKILNGFERLIAINIVVFILVRIISFLFQYKFISLFVLPENLNEIITMPWAIISHMFIHDSLSHVFFNMLFLYYSSTIFLNTFSLNKGLSVYFMGGILGAILYIVSFNVFPAFFNVSGYALGASGAVMAMVVFVGKYFPEKEVNIFITTIKLWQFAAFFVVLDLIQLPNGNSGGHIAHLGGALLGYFYASQLKKGVDIGLWFEKIIDTIISFLTFKNKSKLKTVHKTKSERRATDKTVYQKKRAKQEQTDAILDKISKSGYESLSKEEKAFLFQSGKE